MKRRFPLVLLAALAAFAIPAGSAFASAATFDRPADNRTISQNQTLSVDTTNVPAAVGVDFFIDNAGTPGTYLGGYTIQQADPTSGQAVPYSSNGNVHSFQVAIGGWANPADLTDFTTPYPLTFDAVLIDGTGAQIAGATVQKSVVIDNTRDPLVRGSFTPSPSQPLSGTFQLSLTPFDQNNVITSGTFSVDDGVTTYPLTSDGSGHWSAPVNTVALGLPNGELDVHVRFQDAAGNESVDNPIFYTVANPQAPVITPNTLVADKAQYRTDETQLEVGDIVQAYGMQATGSPTPTIHYLWNICSGPNGQTCTGVTPGPDGSYTVQPGDAGADLMLVATASNGVGRPDFTLVEFGVIAPAYVAPVNNDGGYGDGPQSGDAPQADPIPAPVVTPPVVTPPVVTPPVVVPPVAVITPAEQKKIEAATKTVTANLVAIAKAEKKLVNAKKTLAAAEKALATGTATASEKAAVAHAKVVVNAQAQAAKVASKKLAVAKQTLAVKKAAAVKP